MQTTNCQLYNDFKKRENTWQAGHVSPQQFCGWLHECQLEIQNELIKSLGNNQVIDDNLRFFVKTVQIPISDIGKNGVVKYPKNYRRFVDLRFFSKEENGEGCICSDIDILDENGDCRELTEEEKAEQKYSSSIELYERGIDKVTNNRWGSVCEHEIIKPSFENVYSTQYENGFKVVPKNIGVVVLDYIAIPERPNISYELNEEQEFICTDENSDKLLWGEEMIPELMARLKKRFAAFTKDGESYQMGEQERRITTS